MWYNTNGALVTFEGAAAEQICWLMICWLMIRVRPPAKEANQKRPISQQKRPILMVTSATLLQRPLILMSRPYLAFHRQLPHLYTHTPIDHRIVAKPLCGGGVKDIGVWLRSEQVHCDLFRGRRVLIIW